jgi:hypothetical protein
VFAGDALSVAALLKRRWSFWPLRSRRLRLCFPIAVAGHLPLAIVTISYQQTIHAIPGGERISSLEITQVVAQTAYAALLTDYVLLAAVAVSGAPKSPRSIPLPYRASGDWRDL